jgi:hypothetical protein
MPIFSTKIGLRLQKIVVTYVTLSPGANPTIVSLNTTSCLVRFETKNIFFYYEKCPSLGTTYNAGVVVVPIY